MQQHETNKQTNKQKKRGRDSRKPQSLSEQGRTRHGAASELREQPAWPLARCHARGIIHLTAWNGNKQKQEGSANFPHRQPGKLYLSCPISIHFLSLRFSVCWSEINLAYCPEVKRSRRLVFMMQYSTATVFCFGKLGDNTD